MPLINLVGWYGVAKAQGKADLIDRLWAVLEKRLAPSAERHSFGAVVGAKAKVKDWGKVPTMEPEASPSVAAEATADASSALRCSTLLEAAEWMLALIDGGEKMPKPGDEVAEELRRHVRSARSHEAPTYHLSRDEQGAFRKALAASTSPVSSTVPPTGYLVEWPNVRSEFTESERAANALAERWRIEWSNYKDVEITVTPLYAQPSAIATHNPKVDVQAEAVMLEVALQEWQKAIAALPILPANGEEGFRAGWKAGRGTTDGRDDHAR